MGQKINPTGFRLSVLKNWSSKWYANSRKFPVMLNEDIKVREFLKKKLAHAMVSRIIIERPAKNAKITVYSARPGIVIGKKGEDIESLRATLQKMMGVPVHVNIEEVRKPEIDAKLIAATPAKTVFTWSVLASNSAGQRTRMVYRAVLFTAGAEFSVMARPSGYDNTFSARGNCQPG